MLQELQTELRETRRELNLVKEENEALRFQSSLREDEFHSEEKERRRAQEELRRLRAQLQQLQRQIGEQRVCVYALLLCKQAVGVVKTMLGAPYKRCYLINFVHKNLLNTFTLFFSCRGLCFLAVYYFAKYRSRSMFRITQVGRPTQQCSITTCTIFIRQMAAADSDVPSFFASNFVVLNLGDSSALSRGIPCRHGKFYQYSAISWK